MSFIRLKYNIVGDPAVGKTNLVLRFTADSYKEAHEATIGVDFGFKQVTVNDQAFKLQIWDTPGEEKFCCCGSRLYYRGSSCIFFVYDITSKESYERIPYWIEQVTTIGNFGPSGADDCPVFVLIGNKSDLAVNREVSFEQAKKFADKHNMIFTETSAKSSCNVEEVFESTAACVYEKACSMDNPKILIPNFYNNLEDGPKDHKLLSKPVQKKKTCC
ncbi:unnamed protein product [Moneuplotes crassus]|uniref:Uncharacterized protein n=1 Tax=Euplotes crassus TaxID=5936 RepID=A0AAD1XV60_EUPCR|nr:unnamed protein product [Moneuplotes crassus]